MFLYIYYDETGLSTKIVWW